MKKNNVLETIKKIVTNKKLISLVAAFFSYTVLCFLNILPTYHELSWLVFGCLIIVFIKTDLTCSENPKLKKEIITLAAFFSFLLIYGNLVYYLKSDREISILRSLFTIKSLCSYIGVFNLVYLLLLNIYPKLMEYKIKYQITNKNENKKVFFTCAIIMFLCWLPYFLRYYPGTMTPDSFMELETIVNNFTNVSDHHPVIHILFVALPYSIGYKLFGTITAGVATYTVVQMITLACIFSSSIVFLYKRKVDKKLLIIILLYYSLVPMHGFYSIVMWKDVMFAGMLLLLTMELIKILEKEKRKELDFKNLISFIIVSLLCVFFRNNAIYMYFILVLFTFIYFKKYFKLFFVVFAIVIGTYYVIKGPVFNALNISKSASSEYIGMPLQQVGRMAYKGVKFTKEEKKVINRLIPMETLKDAYNPIVSDGIKFNKEYDGRYFDNHKLECFKIWLQLVIKHPSIAIEAYSISTLGYWYPGVEYWSVAEGIFNDKTMGLKTEPKIDKNMIYYVDHIDSRRVPILCIEWSIALCFWIILIMALVTKKLKNKKSLYIYIPVFGVWLTMILASPVFGEFRYVYGAFTSLPLLMIFPYLKLKK